PSRQSVASAYSESFSPQSLRAIAKPYKRCSPKKSSTHREGSHDDPCSLLLWPHPPSFALDSPRSVRAFPRRGHHEAVCCGGGGGTSAACPNACALDSPVGARELRLRSPKEELK